MLETKLCFIYVTHGMLILILDGINFAAPEREREREYLLTHAMSLIPEDSRPLGIFGNKR